jgi:hypothetical protein
MEKGFGKGADPGLWAGRSVKGVEGVEGVLYNICVMDGWILSEGASDQVNYDSLATRESMQRFSKQKETKEALFWKATILAE